MTPSRSLASIVLLASLALAGCSKQRTCPAGQTLCGDSCRDLRVDPSSCGTCGNVCATGEACGAGACTTCAQACGDGQRCVSGLCVADVYASCFSGGVVVGANSSLAPAGLPLQTGNGPNAITQLGDRLYVANDLDNTISEIRFDPPVRATSGASAIQLTSAKGPFGTYDLQYVASHDGLLYVSNAAVSTLVVVDPATGAVKSEVQLAATPGGPANPRGIGFATRSPLVYVALWDTDEVLVLSCPGGVCSPPMTRISVAAGASPGAQAKPQRIQAVPLPVGDLVFVTLNNLRPKQPFGYEPAGEGRVAVINARGGIDAVLSLPASCESPSAMALSGTTLYVACGNVTFSSPAYSGGAIVPIDVSALGATGPAVGAAQPIDGAPASLAVCGGAAYLGDAASGRIFRVPLGSSGGVTSATVCGASFDFVSDVACAP